MAEERKKLYRTRNERWIAGVCGGIGDYFDMDATVIRVLFVLASFILGGGLWIYLILWIIMPLNPDEFLSVDKPVVVDAAQEESPAEEGE